MARRKASAASQFSRLAELLQWLAQRPSAEQAPTPSELAEVIWLARRLPETSQNASQRVDPTPIEGNDSDPHLDRTTKETDDTSSPPQRRRPPPQPDKDIVAFFPDSPEAPPTKPVAHLLPSRSLPTEQELKAAMASLPIRLNVPRLLPGDLSLLAALRPLMEKAPDAIRSVLDEEATAQRSADARIPLPVYRPRSEPRFSVTLLVDRGLSMEVWQPMAEEFRDVLVRSRSFREVRLIEIVPPPSVRSAVGFCASGSRRVTWREPEALMRRPPFLVDEEDRTLLLVITDTAGPHWWSGVMFEALRSWSHRLPVAMVHTLPHWMAQRTALRVMSRASIWNDVPGGETSRYLSTATDAWEDMPVRGGALPVLRLDPGAIANWAAMAMGDGRQAAPGVMLPRDGEELRQKLDALRPRLSAPAGDEMADANLLWEAFQRSASPEAQRLMFLLAAAPVLTLPVIRLIKEATLPPTSGPFPLLEVLLCGLLQPLPGSAVREPHDDTSASAKEADVNTDAIQYAIHTGVLTLLRKDLSAADTVAVVRMVSELLERRWNALGIGHSFRAVLTDPEIAIEGDELKGVVNFATATADLIERLPGEAYQRFAAQLRRRCGQPARPTWPDSISFEPYDFTTAQLLAIPEPQSIPFTTARFQEIDLHQIPFETATVEIDRAPEAGFRRTNENFGQVSVKPVPSPGSTWAFFEPLQRDVRPLGATAEKPDPLILTMLEIPAGNFEMGSPAGENERFDSEGPQHPVQLEGFFMSQTPITQAQWRRVATWEPRDGETWGRGLTPDPSRFQGEAARLQEVEETTDNRPVEKVNWHEAMEFCSRLSQRTGRTYTLPSEAQWEYACRSGTPTPFHFGATITPELANYDGRFTYGEGPKGEFREQTTPVGNFPANAWGLQDMHGNMWEWCLDHWHDNYEGAPSDGSAWLNSNAAEGEPRLLRGGSWNNKPRNCRSAYRVHFVPGSSLHRYGFRVVCLPQGRSSYP